MRLEDWQKWLDTQFIDPKAVQPEEQVAVTTAPSPVEETQSAPVEAVALAPASVPVAQPAPTYLAASAPASSGSLVDDVEVPSIERYLPFLRGATPELGHPEVQPALADSDEPSVAEPERAAPERDGVEEQPSAVAEAPEPESEPIVEPERSPVAASVPTPIEEAPRRIVRRPIAGRVRPAKHTDSTAIANTLADGGLWDLVPKHIQSLVALGADDVTQNSYKREFRESRIELISRLLDPTLSLEETARLLNVCPTTVRRYTNRGLLTHQRTAGDQRRFKLSDVLSFLEAQSRSESGRPG